VTFYVILIRIAEFERSKKVYDAKIRRSQEKGVDGSQFRWSVAHVHLNYISSGETLRKDCASTEGRRKKERELCDPFL